MSVNALSRPLLPHHNNATAQKYLMNCPQVRDLTQPGQPSVQLPSPLFADDACRVLFPPPSPPLVLSGHAASLTPY